MRNTHRYCLLCIRVRNQPLTPPAATSLPHDGQKRPLTGYLSTFPSMPTPTSKYGTNQQLTQMLCAVLAFLPVIDNAFDEGEVEDSYHRLFSMMDYTGLHFTKDEISSWWRTHGPEYYNNLRAAKAQQQHDLALRSAYEKIITHLSVAERNALGETWKELQERVADLPI